MPRSSEVPPSAIRAKLWRELPLILGLVAGLGFLVHPALPRFGYPHGADWSSYLTNAAHLWLDPARWVYNDWRRPLYPWLIGWLGQGGSYVRAGQWLALGSSLLTVAGAGVLARVLAGPWAGALAALGTASLSVVVDGSWWVNPYPLVSALTALALAAGAWACRWPHPVAASLAGLAAGFAWAVDPRGLAVAAAIPLLVALAPRPPRGRAFLVVLALAGLALGPLTDHRLCRRYQLTVRPLESQVSLQANLSRGPRAADDPEAIAEAAVCREGGGPGAGLEGLTGDCARQRRALNVGLMRRFGQLPPLLPAALLLLSALLPARWGRRSSLAAAVIFLPSVVAMALGMSWVPYTDRYMLPLAVLLGCLGPVALVRLGAVFAQRWPWRGLRALGPILAGLWVVFVFPRFHPLDLLDPAASIARRKGEVPSTVDAREVLAAWARDTLTPNDLLLDCSELRLDVVYLPDTLPVRDGPPHGRWCQERMAKPPHNRGRLFLLTRHRRGPKPDPSLRSPDWVRAQGWEELPLALDLDPDSQAAFAAGSFRRWRYAEAGD